jgi:ABC-type Fe3+/spermidine/putrescine transport system ATPase subunit
MSGLRDTSMKGGSNLPDSAGMLSVNLHQQLGSFQLAVEFHVSLGLIVLFGASGAGKSLTLRGLAGLLRPREGHVAIDGHVLFNSLAGVDLPPLPAAPLPRRERACSRPAAAQRKI